MLQGEKVTFDPRGLINDAYLIDGIGLEECRAIFLDWVLGLPSDCDVHAEIAVLLNSQAGAHADHPMTAILKEGATPISTRPRRRASRR